MLNTCLKKLASDYFDGHCDQLKATPIQGGFSDFANYKIEYLGKFYFLKLLDKACALQRRRFITCTQLASQHGLAPDVLFVPEDQRFILQSYISAALVTFQDLQRTEIWQKIVEVLKNIHGLPHPTAIAATTLKEGIENYQQKMPAAYRSMITDTNEWHYLQNVELNTSSFLHGDLNLNNIFVKDRVCFVDWEFSGQGDCVQDIADLCMSLPPDKHIDVYQYYFADKTPSFSFAKLQNMIRCHYLLYAAWALSELCHTIDYHYQPGRYHSLFATIEANADFANPDFTVDYFEYASEIVRFLRG